VKCQAEKNLVVFDQPSKVNPCCLFEKNAGWDP
jgi:hypothetical protein